MAEPVFGEGSIFKEKVQNIIGLARLSLKPMAVIDKKSLFTRRPVLDAARVSTACP